MDSSFISPNLNASTFIYVRIETVPVSETIVLFSVLDDRQSSAKCNVLSSESVLLFQSIILG